MVEHGIKWLPWKDEKEKAMKCNMLTLSDWEQNQWVILKLLRRCQ
jgi:hypothetical protein